LPTFTAQNNIFCHHFAARREFFEENYVVLVDEKVGKKRAHPIWLLVF
jgi:hypothetical protein